MLEHPTSCLDKQRYKSLKLVFKPSILGKKTFLERLWKAVSQTSEIFSFFMVDTFSWSVENFTLFLPLGGGGGGVLSMMASMERLRPKRVPFTDFRYIMKGQEFHYFE